jgi:hypothetical protein
MSKHTTVYVSMSGRPSKLQFHPNSQHSQQAEQEICRDAFEIAIQDCGHPRARCLRKPGQRGMSQANALELPADLLHKLKLNA